MAASSPRRVPGSQEVVTGTVSDPPYLTVPLGIGHSRPVTTSAVRSARGDPPHAETDHENCAVRRQRRRSPRQVPIGRLYGEVYSYLTH